MEGHDVKTSALVVTLDSQGASLVLQREVAPNGSRTVAYEVIGLRETTFFNQLVEEVVQSSLGDLSRIINPEE